MQGQVTGLCLWVFFVWKVRSHFLLLCFWKVESGAVSNSCIVGEKTLYPPSQKTVSSLRCSFKEGSGCVTVCVSLVCSWVGKRRVGNSSVSHRLQAGKAETHSWFLV